MDKKQVKGFLTGLGIGSVLAGAGVYLSDPKNREKLQEKAEEFKKNADQMLSDLRKSIEEAKEEGKEKLADELEEAEMALRKAQKKLSE